MLHEYDLASIREERTVFWASGNAPTQKVFGLTERVVAEHLKILALLSDRVLAAASFYFESQITQGLTGQLRPLFQNGDVLYFIEATIENFTEHGLRKIEKSPLAFECYRDHELVRTRARELDDLGSILRRPSFSLSQRLVELWIGDVYSTAVGSIGERLRSVTPTETLRVHLETILIDIALSRGEQDFVWEYLGPKLIIAELPENIVKLCRRRLAQMYSAATAKLVGVPLDVTDSGLPSVHVTNQSRYDPALFLGCMEVLQARQALLSLSPTELLSLKGSEEFQFFRLFYFSLIDAVGVQERAVRTVVPILRRAAAQYPHSGFTIEEFLGGFRSLCSALKIDARAYSRPLDILLRSYELLQRCTIEDFLSRLEVIARATGLAYLPVRVERRVIKILFLAANPIDTTALRLGEEMRTIEESLRRAELRDSFEIKQHWAVRVTDLQDYLLRHQPDILHFSGHGTGSKELVLENDAGLAQTVSRRALKNLLAQAGANLRCVVLNACYSENQARAIAEHVDCVIGMSHSLGDQAAISFADGFYRGLGYGKSVQAAFQLGCNQIELNNLAQESIPKLKAKKGVDASQIVFVKSQP